MVPEPDGVAGGQCAGRIGQSRSGVAGTAPSTQDVAEAGV